MILFIAFAAILSITFLVMVLVTSPSQGQKALEHRMENIQAPRGAAILQDQSGFGELLKQQRATKFKGLESLLQKLRLSQRLESIILQANSKTTAVKLLSSCAGFALVGFFIAYLCVPILLVQLAAAAILGYVPFAIVAIKRSRRIAAFNNALPDAIDMMGRALRAGHSMVAAMSVIAEQSAEPVASEFSEVFKQQNFGLPLREALMQMLDRVPSQDLRVLATGILVQKETGGNLAEILDRIVAVIRDRMRIRGEIKTHTAQGRMTGYILCSLPVVMLVVINLVNPGYSKVLLDTPIGHKLMYIGLGLLTIGGLIIRYIINGIEV